jgi:outer membrane lipoprotein carrier protein
MKKLAFVAFFFSSLSLAQHGAPDGTGQLLAGAPDDSGQLLAQLAKINSFSASYEQQVFDGQQELLRQGEGSLLLKKVSRFRFEGVEPEPVLLVSDGQSLWFYEESSERVAIYDAQAQVGQTAFALLTTADPMLWKQYQVIEQQEIFIIHPRDKNNPVQQLVLAFDDHGISEMTVIDINQQQSVFRFTDASLNPDIDDTYFVFDIPDGVDIDDQRQR